MNFQNEELKFNEVSINDKMVECHTHFSDYAIKRAIPNLADGLKMVQRRVIYAMYKDRMFHQNEFFKSVRVVGSVVGKYHPHDDSSAYGTIVKLAQKFNNNKPLLISQGNFGSIDGDPAASARYTEVKLDPVASFHYKHLEHGTVTWSLNFDSTLMEPDILTGELPFALINGVFGIAVGVMSSILPHNMNELLDACIYGLQTEHITTEGILQHILAPDFPNDCEISATNLREVYETGVGSLECRGIVVVEGNCLIVKGIPFNTKTSKILSELNILRKTAKLTEIERVVDETSMEDGMRVRIIVKPGEDTDLVRNKLFKFTSLRKKLFTNMLFIHNNKVIQTNLLGYITRFLDHKILVTRSRLQYFLNELLKDQHRNQILLWCQSNIDFLLSLIRTNEHHVIRSKLKEMDRSDDDIDYILDLSLKTLSKTEQNNLNNKLKSIALEIEKHQEILGDELKLKDYIVSEFREAKLKFGNVRRTKVCDFDAINLVKDCCVFIVIYQGRYLVKHTDELLKVKRLTNKANNYKTSFGVPTHLVRTNNREDSFYFGTDGSVFSLTTNQIPEMGEAEQNYLSMVDAQKWLDSKVEVRVILNRNIQASELLAVSENGMVARFRTKDLFRLRNGSKLFNTKSLVSVIPVESTESKVMLTTAKGLTIAFLVSEVRLTNRGSKGVRGIKLSAGDRVVSAIILQENQIPYIFTENGFGKGIGSNFTITHRNARGYKSITLRGKDRVISMKNLSEQDSFVIIMNQGDLFQTTTKDINIQSTKSGFGQKIVKLNDGNFVTKVL